jgi:GUN4-like/DnaJ domain
MNTHLHYLVLEIEPGSSQDKIREAYKDLVKVWHPDRFSEEPRLQQKAEEKLKKINAAYEFLKSDRPQANSIIVEPEPEQSIKVFLNCEKLEKLLELGKLKEADHETKRLLLELAGREQEGWLLVDDPKRLPPQALLAIDRLWIKYSDGRFGFSVQSKIWRNLDCKSSNSVTTQTISENTFGQFVRWRIGGRWLSQWDAFDYNSAHQGSLPREYIFALNGWWSFVQGWTGYSLMRFDEIFLQLSNQIR